MVDPDFDPEVAILYARTLAKYGVKSILFNCPYVIDKAKDVISVSGNYKTHHHHFHIDFGKKYTKRGKEFLCFGEYEGEPYTCSYYDQCTYIKKRKR